MGGTIGLGKEKRQEAGNLQRSETNDSKMSKRRESPESPCPPLPCEFIFRCFLAVLALCFCHSVFFAFDCPGFSTQVDGSTIQNIAYQYAPYWEWQGDDGIYVPYDSSIALMLEKAHRKLPRRDYTCAVIRASIENI